MPVIEARFMSPSDTVIIDGTEFPVYEIDKSAILPEGYSDRIAVRLQPCIDSPILFQPDEYIQVK